jgi:hypothetical protein
MVGLAGLAAAFAAAALAGSVEASWLGVLLVGLTTGLFNVAVLAPTMAMSVPERVALFMPGPFRTPWTTGSPQRAVRSSTP